MKLFQNITKSDIFGIFALILTFSLLLAGSTYAEVSDTGLIVTSMSTPFVTTNYMRGTFGRFHKFLKLNYNVGENPVITRTDLRLHAELTPGKNTIEFEALKGTGNTDGALEIKLDKSHIFMVTHFGLSIQRFNPKSGVTAPNNEANYPLFTYPDRNYFIGAKTDSTEAESLETLYQSQLTLSTGSATRWQGMPTNHLKYVPDSQFLIKTGDQVADEYPQYGPTMEQRGYFEIHPNLILKGDTTNKFIISNGAGDNSCIDGAVDAAGGAVDTRNRAVLLVHGFLYSGDMSSDSPQCVI